MEKDFREKDDATQDTIDKLKLDNAKGDVEKRDLQRQKENLYSEVVAYKSLNEDKSLEVMKMRAELNDMRDFNSKVIQDKNRLETDLLVLEVGKKKTAEECEMLKNMNERLAINQMKDEEKIKDQELSYKILLRRFDDAKDDVAKIELEKRRLKTDLEVVREGSKLGSYEKSKILFEKSEIEDEKRKQEQKAKSLEYDLARLEKRLTDSNVLLRDRGQELETTKRMLTREELKSYDAKYNLNQIEKEKDLIASLADKHRKDAVIEKKLRTEELRRNLELERENKLKDRIVKDKEADYYLAKRELQKVADAHDELLDHNYYLAKEADAYKEHADVLDFQNMRVSFGFVNFVILIS